MAMLALATTALSCIVTNVHMTGAVGPVMVVQRIYAWIVYTMDRTVLSTSARGA
jgi:hypothetical protein